MKSKDIKLYNMILPIWMLIIFPPAWIVTIPMNFIIDSLVLIVAMKVLSLDNRKDIYKKTILPIVIFGYLSDLIGGGLLTALSIFNDFYHFFKFSNELSFSIAYAPTESLASFLIVSFFVIVSGIFIYIFNYKLSFKKLSLSCEIKKKLALALAIFTAPYTFLISLDFLNNFFNLY
ncbi:hypothetical protein [Peptoniphilus catoniae]|uniref:hypothetical protein n=1 Tax=Peptoniphilus catoniae TaxID=1660341 RepID=UPI0010FE9EB2|nr:hypothetical protein [Peptoniphilus catoniae]